MRSRALFLSILLLIGCGTNDPMNLADPGFWLLGPNRLSVYFTDPGIDENTGHDMKVDQRIVDMINDAKVSVDFATYNLGKQSILTALINARERGIRVRMVGDVDEAVTDGYRTILQYGKIPFSLGNAAAIQHNKFAIFDGKYVFMGTGNHTDSDLIRNNNNFLAIESSELAAAYTREFEQMYYGRFAAAKTPPASPARSYSVGMTPLELYFSPEDGDLIIRRMIQLVDSAKVSVNFMIFAFTDDELSAALVRAARRGVLVRGVHDFTFIYGVSEEASRIYNAGRYMPTGPFNREDGNENTTVIGVAAHGGKLHVKTMIIDGQIVCTGSFNWSTNAIDNNDENMVVVHSAAVASEMQKQWDSVWAVSRPITNQLWHQSGEAANYGDVIISELMWAGSYDTTGAYTNDDDWLELKNMTNHSIDVSHWSLSWDYEGWNNYPIPDRFNWFEDSVHSRHRSGGRIIIPANGYLLLKNANAAIATDQGDNKISGTKDFNLDSGSFHVRLYDLTMNLIDEAGTGEPPPAGLQDATNKRTFSMERFFYPTGHPLAGQPLPGGGVGSWYTSNGNNFTIAGTLAGTGQLAINFSACDGSNQKCTIATPNYSGDGSAPASNAYGGINNAQNIPIAAYSTSSTSAVIQMRWGMVQTPVVNCFGACGGLCTGTALDSQDPAKILIGTVPQTAGGICTVTVLGGYTDVSNPNGTGFALGGTISLEGHGNPNAQMEIYRVYPNRSGGNDIVVLRALTSGTVHNLGIYYMDSFSPYPQRLYRMHDVPITAGQFIMLTLNSSTLSEDLLLGSNPTINIADAGTPAYSPIGFADASWYEVYSTQAGVSSTDGLIFISYDPQGIPMDAMCYSNRDGDMASGLMSGGMRTLFNWGMSVYNLSVYPLDLVNDSQIQDQCSSYIVSATGNTGVQRNTDTNNGSDFSQF